MSAKNRSLSTLCTTQHSLTAMHSVVCFSSHMDAPFHPPSMNLTPCSRDKRAFILKTLTSPARPNYDQQPLKMSGYENSYTTKISYPANIIYFGLSHSLLHKHNKEHSNHPPQSLGTFTRHEWWFTASNSTKKKTFQVAVHQLWVRH